MDEVQVNPPSDDRRYLPTRATVFKEMAAETITVLRSYLSNFFKAVLAANTAPYVLASTIKMGLHEQKKRGGKALLNDIREKDGNSGILGSVMGLTIGMFGAGMQILAYAHLARNGRPEALWIPFTLNFLSVVFELTKSYYDQTEIKLIRANVPSQSEATAEYRRGGASEMRAELVAEREPVAAAESEPAVDLAAESGERLEPEPVAEPEPEPEPEPVAEAEPEPEPEPAAEAEPETEAEVEPEEKVEAQFEPDAVLVSEPAADTTPESDGKQDSEEKLELEIVPDLAERESTSDGHGQVVEESEQTLEARLESRQAGKETS